MRTIPIVTGLAAALLATALVTTGPARSQPAPPAPPADDPSEEMMTFDFDDGMDEAPWDEGGPGAPVAPDARGPGRGARMHRAPGAPGRGMHMGRGGGPGGFGMMLGPVGRLLHGGARLADELKLTKDQRDQLRDIGDGLARGSIQARADMELAHLDMAKLLRDDTPDRARIAARIDEIAQMRATHMKQVLDAGLDARKALTAEQLKKLEELRPGMGRGQGRGAGQGQGRGTGRAPGAGQGRGL